MNKFLRISVRLFATTTTTTTTITTGVIRVGLKHVMTEYIYLMINNFIKHYY